MKEIYSILRKTSIPLLITAIFTIFSGFLITKNFLVDSISYDTSLFIHTKLLPLIFIALLYLHAIAGTLIICVRSKKFNNSLTKISIILTYTLIFSLFFFMFFAERPTLDLDSSKTTQEGNINSQEEIIQDKQITEILKIKLNSLEISKHNKISDCWMIIENKVYDLTSYMNYHPPGSDELIPYCGKNGTNAFNTKNKGSPHSSAANDILDSLFIGNLDQEVKEDILIQRIGSINTSSNSNGNYQARYEEEDDDDWEDDWDDDD